MHRKLQLLSITSRTVAACCSLVVPSVILATRFSNAGFRSFTPIAVPWSFAQAQASALVRKKDLRQFVKSAADAELRVRWHKKIGVSVPVLYKWKKDLTSDETYKSLRKRNAALRIRTLCSVKSSA